MANAGASKETLYARIGGYDMIAAIVDEFSQTLASDPQFARFIAAMGLDTRKRNRQLTVDYLCAESGGPAFYLGRDMKTAHAGLGVRTSDWNIAMDHVERAMVKFGLPEAERKEFLGLFTRLADQVIEA